MRYKLLLTKRGKDDLYAIEKRNQIKIVKKLKFYLLSDNPLNYAKKLKDSRLGTYRFRIGDYRAIFDIDKQGNINILLILRIKHRKDACL